MQLRAWQPTTFLYVQLPRLEHPTLQRIIPRTVVVLFSILGSVPSLKVRETPAVIKHPRTLYLAC